MTLQALLAVVCLWCSTTPAVAVEKQELCYHSSQGLHGHVYHHKTPSGVCYHTGPRNHSTIFADTKPSPLKAGYNTIVTPKGKDWSHAKPYPYRIQQLDYEIAKHWDWRVNGGRHGGTVSEGIH